MIVLKDDEGCPFAIGQSLQQAIENARHKQAAIAGIPTTAVKASQPGAVDVVLRYKLGSSYWAIMLTIKEGSL